MKPSDVPEELIDLAMTGARPGCRGDAAFYLANVLPEIRRRERAKVAEEARKLAAQFGDTVSLRSDAATLVWFADRTENGGTEPGEPTVPDDEEETSTDE
jgi:hypothetical protein